MNTRLRLFRTRMAFMMLALPLVPGFGAGSAAAQDRGVPASLLKRLAEAVDGYRTGISMFVVADSHPPHTIRGVFSNRPEAADAATRAGGTFGAFGPFFAPVDPGDAMIRILPLPHPPLSFGTDTLRIPREGVAMNDVRNIVVTINTRDGRAVTSTYAPNEADAVFFTLSALDKFVFPYYARVYGVTAAAQVRAAYIRGLPR